MSGEERGWEELKEALKAFNAARDWERFHTAKDLAMALAVESGELLELYLWRGEAAAPAERVAEELGDVVLCILNYANRVGVNPLAAAWDKLERNGGKYPVALAKGRADKWDVLAREQAQRGEE